MAVFSGIWYAAAALGPRVQIVLGAVCLVAAIAVFALCASHDRGGRRGFRAFVDFDRLVIAPIAKFSYLLLAFVVAVFGVAAVVLLCVEGADFYEAGELAAFAMAWVAQIVVAQILLRVAFELSLLLVKLVENTSRLCALAEEGRQSGSPAGEASSPDSGAAGARPWEPVSPPPAAAGAAGGEPACDRADPAGNGGAGAAEVTRPLGPAVPAGATAPLAADGAPDARWDCSCGARGNTGTFCGRCGAHRP